VPLSSHFRINAANTGQFERTLIIAERGARLSYMEGCTAAGHRARQLHAGVAELVALDDAEIAYSTVQQWPAGDASGGGVDNFDTKRGICRGRNARISWTQVETGSAINWKYPACVLEGDNSVGEFYAVSFTGGHQQADTGTKMIHLGRNTRSRIVAKGISAGRSDQTYRGLVRMTPKADGARNFTQCDSMLIGQTCGAHTVPYIENKNRRATAEHEATTSKISADQLFYCRQRGLSEEKAVALVVNGFCQEVLEHLPLNMAMEAKRLLDVSLEGSVG
jgi:Fe-S cluster assembly protein SufB